MTAKLNPFAAAPSLMKDWQRAMINLAATSSFEPSLSELVKLRASQINGCANCINLHATEARANGETEQRIYLLPAWREAPCYTDRERAALAWTEALTRLSEGNGLASAYETLKAQFTEEEQLKLTLMTQSLTGGTASRSASACLPTRQTSNPPSRRLRPDVRPKVRGCSGGL
jgi:AhpD family alkylhydroperoxidase